MFINFQYSFEFDAFSNIIVSRFFSIFSFAFLFRLITLFLCCFYLKMLDSVFDFKTIFRNLSLHLISVLSLLVNHGLSLFLTVTNLDGIHPLAIWTKVSVNVLHISSTSFKLPRSAFQSVLSNFCLKVSVSI